jgi:hypothetical protein
MADAVLLDNDIMLKACSFSMVEEVVHLLGMIGGIWILGTARFVLQKRISRSGRIINRGEVAAALEHLLKTTSTIEPDGAEIAFAAELEEAAQKRALDFDSGESLLLAVLILRSCALLLTVDKRAIHAMEPIATSDPRIGKVAGKIACLEQLMMALLKRYGAEVVRDRVCREPDTDKSLAICFSCNGNSFVLGHAVEGLRSYIGDIRKRAPTILIASCDLSPLVT